MSSIPARAQGGLDVKDWLSRPGVKLVAVEFYATWCKPCMDAVPKWKELHDRYRAQGLRLVVVSVQDRGACASPDWTPDAVVCDEEGILQQRWKADNLPQAFLWSWQGHMLVAHGSVEQVEAEIETYFEQVPRILMNDPVDERNQPLPDAVYVKKIVRAELGRGAKFELVADESTREELRRLKKEGRGLQYDDKRACKVGQEVSPNSTLSMTRRRTDVSDSLILELFSVEKGCLTASSKVRVMNGEIDAAVAEAVTQLVQALAGEVNLPGGPVRSGGTGKIEERDIGDKPEEWSMNVETGVLVDFDSDPAGAVVLLDGKLLCQETPCSKTVPAGDHKLEMQKESYVAKSEGVKIKKGNRAVRWKLTPDFGWLTVRSKPSGLVVTVDARPFGKTPLVKRQLPAGPYQVLVTDPRYYERGRQVQVERGEHEELDLSLQARQGGIKIAARDQKENDLRAEVWLDGKKAGSTPFAEKVLIGEHLVRVVMGDAVWKKRVDVEEKQVVDLRAELDPGRGRGQSVTEQGDGRKRKEGERNSEFFYFSLSFTEGILPTYDRALRTNIAGELAGQLRFSWFRWEVLSAGISFEKPYVWNLGSAALFDIGGLFFRTGLDLLLEEGRSYLGIEAGAGYSFFLGRGWYIDLELDLTIFPGHDVAVPIEARLGVRYGI